MNEHKITAMMCDDNPFVDYFKPLLYHKEPIATVIIGYNEEMIFPENLQGLTCKDVQSYDPRISRWCLLMFLVESFKITEEHVRRQCYIDEEDFPDLDLVPYNKFCRMLGYSEINGLLNDYFWGSDTNGKDSDYIVKTYIPDLKRAFKKNMNVMFQCCDDAFEYSINVITLKDHRYPDGGMTIKISSDNA